MTTDGEAGRIKSPWTTYLKAAFFLAPPVIAFIFFTVFVLPKIKQICADAGYRPGNVFTPIDFLAQRGGVLLVLLASLLLILELFFPAWRKYRNAAVATLVFLLNSAVLLALSSVLVVSTIAGPALARLR